jgi:hypothetical protein
MVGQDPLPRCSRRALGQQRGAVAGGHSLQAGREHIVLAAEELVHRALGDARRLGQRLDADVDALAVEEVGRRVEQAVTRVSHADQTTPPEN